MAGVISSSAAEPMHFADFRYLRTIYFRDTDAAGVVYFANLLSICHEAYEASLAAAGIDVRMFFSSQPFAVPIVHAEADFFHPLFCGDRIVVALQFEGLKESEFQIRYEIWPDQEKASVNRSLAKALTRHVCIDVQGRSRRKLPEELIYWLQL